MALTRNMLKSLGIEEDKINLIIEAHTEVTDALKAERDKYKEMSENLEEVQKQLDSLKNENVDTDGKSWKEKYNSLNNDFSAYKTEQETKETTAKKDAAYRKLLQEAGVSEKRFDAVMRLTDLSKVELNKDGTIKGHDAVLNDIKEEWSEYIGTINTQGADSHNPPAGNGSGTTMTKADILKIKDKNERQKAISENHELFGY